MARSSGSSIATLSARPIQSERNDPALPRERPPYETYCGRLGPQGSGLQGQAELLREDLGDRVLSHEAHADCRFADAFSGLTLGGEYALESGRTKCTLLQEESAQNLSRCRLDVGSSRVSRHGETIRVSVRAAEWRATPQLFNSLLAGDFRENQPGDVREVVELGKRPSSRAERQPEGWVSGMPDPSVLDVSVITREEEQRISRECLEDAGQEPIDALESGHRAGHPSSMTGHIGVVVGIHREIGLHCDATQVRARLLGRHHGEVVVTEVMDPSVVQDLGRRSRDYWRGPGDRDSGCLPLAPPGEEPTPASNLWFLDILWDRRLRRRHWPPLRPPARGSSRAQGSTAGEPVARDRSAPQMLWVHCTQ